MQYQKFLQDISSVLTMQVLEGKRDRDTERHRYTERKTKTETGWHRQRQADTDRDRQTQTETDGKQERPTGMWVDTIAAHLIRHPAEGGQEMQPWFENEASVHSSLPLPQPPLQTIFPRHKDNHPHLNMSSSTKYQPDNNTLLWKVLCCHSY